jgi:GAF domain-containing protein
VEDTYEAFLSVPLLSGGDVTGVINVHHREPRVHSAEEIALLALLGQQMGGAIARARLMEENARLQGETLEMNASLKPEKSLNAPRAETALAGPLRDVRTARFSPAAFGKTRAAILAAADSA